MSEEAAAASGGNAVEQLDPPRLAPEPGSPERSIERVAEGQTLSEPEVDALTAFFLGERKQRPGETGTKDFTVELVPDAMEGQGETMRVTLRSITWEQWQEAQRLAGTVKDSAGDDMPNQYAQASYVVAYGMVRPDLGALRAQFDEAVRPKDTALMLRDFFRHEPGVLLNLQTEILRMSRLLLTQSAVKEVDAGKS